MRRTKVAFVLLLSLVASPAIGGLLTAAGRDPIFIISGVVLIGALVATLAIRHCRTEQRGDKDEGSWSLIPDWQYEGRFAEAGGLTLSEQSEEIEKIRADAKGGERGRKRPDEDRTRS